MYQEKQWPEVGTLGSSRLDGTCGGQMVLDADAECTRIEVVLKPTRSRSIADSPSFWRSTSCGTLSKAFAKSRNAAS